MNDTNKEYFVDFGPELLKLLGPNLYTNIYYVLGEIIANAYDADAQNVYIIYSTETNSIIIEDDGNGMSYTQINESFLPIGVSSRDGEEDTFTESGNRKRMGRKGIGKLAALSVSKKIKVTSMRDGEKSGCVLSLDISEKSEDGRYKIPSIDDKDIKFEHIEALKHGSAIIMENSRYSIHKSIESAKRNISLIFPYACKEFRIHLENTVTSEKTIIDDFVKEIITSSDALITYCDASSKYNDYLTELHRSFDNGRYYRILQKELSIDELPEQKKLNISESAISERITLVKNDGTSKVYDLIINGWISTYAESKYKKRNTDFPVNYISVIAHDKLGQFDILPDITIDRMTESYVVGQFYIDLLEETELPDIASSNRQGYKGDDERFIKTLELIKKSALRPILALKDTASKEKNYLRDLEKENLLKKSKEQFDVAIRSVIEDPDFKKVINNSQVVKTALEQGWQLKDTLKEAYKKVMISHSVDDKEIANELEKILHFVGLSKEEIIYTSSSYYESCITGAYTNIYEYLKDFFVNTTKRNDLSVIYILNQSSICKWNPVLEAGAGWVLNTKWFPMYTDEFKSVLKPFEQSEYMPFLSFNITNVQANYLASAIFQIALNAGKNEQDEASILHFIETSTKFVSYK